MALDTHKSKRQDGARKWLILASSYVVMVVDIGVFYSIGSLFLAVMEQYQSSRAETSVLQATLFGVSLGAGILTGSVVKRFGAKKVGLFGSVLVTFGAMASFFATSIIYLVISIGVIMALGCSMLFIGCSTVTGEHFQGKSNAIALSVLSTGSGVGGMLYPYLLAHLNNIYGLRGTFLLISGIVANSFACCFLWSTDGTETENASSDSLSFGDNYKPSEQVDQAELNVNQVNKLAMRESRRTGSRKLSIDDFAELDSTKSVKAEVIGTYFNAMAVVGGPEPVQDKTGAAIEGIKALMKDKTFTCFAAALTLSYSAISIVLIFIVDLFTDKGFDESDASLGLLILNMFSTLGRLCPGFIMQIQGFPTIGVPVVASLLGIFSMIGLILVTSLLASLVMCALIGLSLGIFVTMITVAPARLFGQENLPMAIGIICTSNGIASAISGPVSGLMRDLNHSYDIPFFTVAGCLTLACLLYAIAQHFHRKTKKISKERRLSVFYVTKF